MAISGIKHNAPFSAFLSVKYKHPPAPYQNGFKFEVGLADRSGETELFYWGGRDAAAVQKTYDSFSADDVVFVEGVGSEFKGKLRIAVNEGKGTIRKAAEGEYKLEDLIASSNQDAEKLFAHLLGLAKSFKDKHLKALMLSFLEDVKFAGDFKRSPAAMYHHHACIGGLLEHTWGVVRICETACDVHPSLDRELALAGAMLHDVGKMREFRVTTNIKVTEEGMLRSHISLGEEMVLERIKRIPDFPEILRNKLVHFLISHHGKKEHGAVKEPQFAEAKLVSAADDLDAQLSQFIRARKDAVTEDFRLFHRSLGELYLR